MENGRNKLGPQAIDTAVAADFVSSSVAPLSQAHLELRLECILRSRWVLWKVLKFVFLF